MKIRDLAAKELLSVPCPVCGVPAGHRCVLQAGGPRLEPHTDRKVYAAEAIANRREFAKLLRSMKTVARSAGLKT